MCLTKERKPTDKEQKTKFAWKAFEKKYDGLYSIFNHTSVAYHVGWNIADGLEEYPDDAGFYCFLNKEDAKFFSRSCCKSYYPEEFVFRKVEIAEIMGIGETAHIDNELNGIKNTIRCKRIRIPSLMPRA